MGVIDAISAGFRLVVRKPLLMLIPILLDLFLWLGPRLSVQPIAAKAAQQLSDLAPRLVEMGAAEANLESLYLLVDLLQSNSTAQGNLFVRLVWGFLGMPSTAEGALWQPMERSVLYVSEYWQLILFNLSLLALGLMITAIFLSVLGNQMRGEPLRMNRLAEWTVATWLRLVVVMIPIGFAIMATLFAMALFGPFAVVPLVGLVWLLIYVSFFPQAIAMAGHSPLGAILSSVQIVRINLWPTIRLLLVILLLSNGLGLIWQRLIAHSTVGVMAAIAASAYVGTALTAALFVFYRDRLILLHSMLTEQRSA